MSEGRIQVAASILTADFGNLWRVVRKLERAGVDRLHLDVMDGRFVPNITFGPDVVAAIRRLTRLPLDVHLMIAEPSRYVARFVEAGGDSITFHLEAEEPPATKHDALRAIRDTGRAAGLAISPATPPEALGPYLAHLDIVMVMTVEPGWGGQRFRHDCADKVHTVRLLLAERDAPAAVHVDGGVSHETAELVGSRGGEVLIVGSALFQRGRDTALEVRRVRELAAAGWRSATGAGAEHVGSAAGDAR